MLRIENRFSSLPNESADIKSKLYWVQSHFDLYSAFIRFAGMLALSILIQSLFQKKTLFVFFAMQTKKSSQKLRKKKNHSRAMFLHFLYIRRSNCTMAIVFLAPRMQLDACRHNNHIKFWTVIKHGIEYEHWKQWFVNGAEAQESALQIVNGAWWRPIIVNENSECCSYEYVIFIFTIWDNIEFQLHCYFISFFL